MSSMLKESIVDAKALRESALKNAESVVIQKYSEEVKNTLEKLLEQEEEPALDLGMEPEGTLDLGASPAEEPLEEAGTEEEVVENQEDVAFAATNGLSKLDGQKLKDLPSSGDNIEVTIDLGALQEALTEINQELDDDIKLEVDTVELSDELKEEEDLEEGDKPDFLDLDKDGDKEEPMKGAAADKDKKKEVKGQKKINTFLIK